MKIVKTDIYGTFRGSVLTGRFGLDQETHDELSAGKSCEVDDYTAGELIAAGLCIENIEKEDRGEE